MPNFFLLFLNRIIIYMHIHKYTKINKPSK